MLECLCQSNKDQSLTGCWVFRFVLLLHMFHMHRFIYRIVSNLSSNTVFWYIHIQKFSPNMALNATQITRSLEAYILWLTGKVMFTENHVTTISARYIDVGLPFGCPMMNY